MTARTRIAVLLSVAALTVAGCADDEPTAEDPSPASGSTKNAGGGDPETDAPSESGGTTDTATVPVYFVGDTPQGVRLYREFRQVAADDPAAAALALLTAGDALDPDYRTLYPGGTFAGVEIGADQIEVSLPDDSWTTANGMSESDARMAAQQLVYTVQGIAQARIPVEILLDGQPADLFGLGGELGNDPELDVRALVNVTTPEEGATVGDTFTASGAASSFEATVPWEIRQGDTVVKTGFSTAEGWMDKLYPWQAEVDVSDLEPGDYTFVALTDDPSDGEGGGPTEDSKTITVQ